MRASYVRASYVREVHIPERAVYLVVVFHSTNARAAALARQAIISEHICCTQGPVEYSIMVELNGGQPPPSHLRKKLFPKVFGTGQSWYAPHARHFSFFLSRT